MAQYKLRQLQVIWIIYFYTILLLFLFYKQRAANEPDEDS